ncbi:MAG: type II secretion system protein [Candidatus Eisenbacteria bacterium]
MSSHHPFGRVLRSCVNALSPRRECRGGSRASRGLRGQRGMTIIEVLVSVVVLAIAVTPMFDAFVRGRVLVAHRAEERIALRLVERKLEQLLAAGGSASGSDADVTSVNMDAGTHPVNSAITLITRGDSDTSNDVLADLTWAVTSVTWTDPMGVSDDTTYKQVVVTLAWPLGAHRDDVSVTTIVS